jgi:protein TonB
VKQLGLAAILAVAVHIALFWVEMPLAKPVLPASQGRSVDISLVTIQKTIRETKPTPKEPKPESLPKPVPKKKPAPKPKPKKTPPPIPKAPTPIKPLPATLPTMAALEPLAPIEAIEEAPTAAPIPAQTKTIDETPAAKPETTSSPLSAASGGPPAITMAKPIYRLNSVRAYPSLAKRRGYEGTVILDVLVDETGRVVELEVAQSSGFRILDRSAMADVKAWRFEPARKGGRAISMPVKVPVRYEID